MKILFSLVGILAIFEATTAYIMQSPAPMGKNAGKCVYQKKVLPKGTSYVDGCEKVDCSEDGSYSVEGCPTVTCPPNCKLGKYVNGKKNFPDCCIRVMTCELKDGPKEFEVK